MIRLFAGLVNVGPIEECSEDVLQYPEQVLAMGMDAAITSSLYITMLHYIYSSREYYMKLVQDDYADREKVKQILLDQAVVFIRAMLDMGLMKSSPRETGAFIHTLTMEWPKALIKLHQLPPYDLSLVPLMIEYVPSMQMLLDNLEDSKYSIFQLTLYSCLACKFPTNRTLEFAKKLFSNYISGETNFDDSKFHVLRLLIRAFPPIVEMLSCAPCMQCLSGYEEILGADIKLITDAVKKPIYRTIFSCILPD